MNAVLLLLPPLVNLKSTTPYSSTDNLLLDIDLNDEPQLRQQIIMEFDSTFIDAAKATVNAIVILEQRLRGLFPPTTPQVHDAIIELQSCLCKFIPHLRAALTRQSLSSELFHKLVHSGK